MMCSFVPLCICLVVVVVVVVVVECVKFCTVVFPLIESRAVFQIRLCPSDTFTLLRIACF